MIHARNFLKFLLTGSILLLTRPLLAAEAPSTALSSPAPSKELKPTDVVKIQIDALRTNDEKNEGIATCFRFASPGNQGQVGPLERFVVLVKTPPYDKLLNFTEARFGPVVNNEDGTVAQAVVLIAADKTEAAFLFILSKQTEGEQKDCWLTDGVVPFERAGELEKKPV